MSRFFDQDEYKKDCPFKEGDVVVHRASGKKGVVVGIEYWYSGSIVSNREYSDKITVSTDIGIEITERDCVFKKAATGLQAKPNLGVAKPAESAKIKENIGKINN